MFNEVIDECKQLVLEVISFHVLSAWVKHQIADINIQGLPNAKKFCGMHRIPNVFKISFFPLENIFFSIL